MNRKSPLNAARRRANALAIFVAAGATSACGGAQGGASQDDEVSSMWSLGPVLPRPVANNAVVGLDVDGESHVYSFMGMSASKRWDGVVPWAFRWVMGSGAWEELPPVPGPGRLAATAEALDGKVYLFGGYTVAADGSEASVPNVDVFDPVTKVWSAAAPIPVPVDDAVSGVWGDSVVVLVSGWHDSDNVPDVQLYHPGTNTWSSATPIPGPPVFGHAGKVAGNRIVYTGGANTRGESPRYRIEPSSWAGDLGGPAHTIAWHALDGHPGPLRYRAASAAVGDWVVFAGGTDNPYNYDGMGYDRSPASPTASVFGFHAPTGQWVAAESLPAARMDHRALALAGSSLVLVGGMDNEQLVRAEVFVGDAGAIVRSLVRGIPGGSIPLH